MKIVFFGCHHYGHFNPTKSLVKLFLQNGHEVHYFATLIHKGEIETTGASYHHYGCEDWSLRQAAIDEVTRLNCQVTDYLKNGQLSYQSLVASIGLLPYLLGQIDLLKPDFFVCDSSYPWGFLLGQILRLPVISSCSSTLMSTTEIENTFSSLRDIDYNHKAVTLLQEKYNLKYNPAESYCNYTEFTIVWCIEEFLHPTTAIEVNSIIHYFGVSLDESFLRADKPSSTTTELLATLAALKQKSHTIIYVSLGTVVGTDSWAIDPTMFYLEIIQAFGNKDDTTNQNYATENQLQFHNDKISQEDAKMRPQLAVLLSVGKVYDANKISKNLPTNIMITNYAPQLDVLRLADIFISHCGMNSTNEALFNNIPVIAVPIFGDQHFNANRIHNLKCGIQIVSPYRPLFTKDFSHVTATILQKSVGTILINYKEFKLHGETFRQLMLNKLRYFHQHALDDMLTWVHSKQKELNKKKDHHQNSSA